MARIRFDDRMEFDTAGLPRLVRRFDGLYVVGDGWVCAVDSEKEGAEVIAQLTRIDREKKGEGP